MDYGVLYNLITNNMLFIINVSSSNFPDDMLNLIKLDQKHYINLSQYITQNINSL